MKRKNILFLLATGVLVLSACAWTLGRAGWRLPRPPIVSTPEPEGAVIALTFDDGPNPAYTGAVLDVLYENNAPATFFIMGSHVHGNEKLLRQILGEGHEVGNHTYSHTDLTTLTAAEIMEEVERTQEAIDRAVFKRAEISFVRPPYGWYDNAVLQALAAPAVLWDIDSGDWTVTTAQEISNLVLSSVQDGDVVVFHDNNRETVEALKVLLPKLKQSGFQPVTLSQLYELKGGKLPWAEINFNM